MSEPTKTELIDIGLAVSIVALDMFQFAGRESDFCVQDSDNSGAVFGGSNRLLYCPKNGWQVDEPYCSKDFIEKFKEWKGIKGMAYLETK